MKNWKQKCSWNHDDGKHCWILMILGLYNKNYHSSAFHHSNFSENNSKIRTKETTQKRIEEENVLQNKRTLR